MSYFGLGLFLALLSSFFLRVFNLDYNSPFLDEAIYIVLGKRLLAGDVHQAVEATSWVGGYPLFYPAISALAYEIGGIVGARFVNAVLGTFAVFFIFLYTKNLELFGRQKLDYLAGLVSAFLLATSGIPIIFSRLAIYDTLSFSLFLLGLVLLQKALRKVKTILFFVSAFVFFLSFLAKYVVLFFLPVLLLVSILFAKRREYRKAFAYFSLPLLLSILTYFFLNAYSLNEFFFGQLATKDQYSEILGLYIDSTKLAYFLFFLGSIFFLKRKPSTVASLFLISLVPLLSHLLLARVNAIDQHSQISLFFILPVASVLPVFIFQKQRLLGALVGLIIIFFNTYFAFPQVKNYGNFWPNSQKAMEYLEKMVKREDKIYAEAGDVVTLALYDDVNFENITGPFVFEYKGKEGNEAYKLAFSEGFFDFVQFDGVVVESKERQDYEKRLLDNYLLGFDDGKIKIYQKR